MKTIKTFEFFNESNTVNKSSIKLKDNEMDLFNTQGALRNLINDDKIKLNDNQVSFDANDESVTRVLSNYFDI